MLILRVHRWQLLAKFSIYLVNLSCISRSCHLTCAKVATKSPGLAIFPRTCVARLNRNADNYHMCDMSTWQSLIFLMASLVMRGWQLQVVDASTWNKNCHVL